MAAHKALYRAYPVPQQIDLVYKQCAANLPPLNLQTAPDQVWQQALEQLTREQSLDRLWEILLSSPSAEAIRPVIEEFRSALAAEPRAGYKVARTEGGAHWTLAIKIVESQRRFVLRSPLISLAPDRESLDFLLPSLVRPPNLQSRRLPGRRVNLRSTLITDQSSLLIGPAGFGKTLTLQVTYLRFVKSFLESSGANAVPLFFNFKTLVSAKSSRLTDLLRATVKEFGLSLTAQEAASILNRDLVLFIDGCDEISSDSISFLRTVLVQFIGIPRLVASRTDFFQRVFLETELLAHYDDVVELREWSNSDILTFVELYLRKLKRTDIHDLVRKRIQGKDGNVLTFLRSPLALTMLLFSELYSSPSRLPPSGALTRTMLISEFIDNWLAYEANRGRRQRFSAMRVREAWAFYAWYTLLAGNRRPVTIAELVGSAKREGVPLSSVRTSAFASLLRLSESGPRRSLIELLGFRHEVIAEFLAAEALQKALLHERGEKLHYWLSFVAPYEITVFLREALDETLTDASRAELEETLITAYQTRIGTSVADITVRNQATYYLGRLGGPTAAMFLHSLLLEILDGRRQEHPMITGTVATGLLLHPERHSEIVLRFLRKLLDAGELDVRNRSFHLAYYGDKVDNGPETYITDIPEGDDWQRTRRALCSRISASEGRSNALRPLDLVTLLRLIETREYVDPTDVERMAVANCLYDRDDADLTRFCDGIRNRILSLWEVKGTGPAQA